MPKAKLFVDHALEKGWDHEKGGFYEQGKYIDDMLENQDLNIKYLQGAVDKIQTEYDEHVDEHQTPTK